MSKKPAPSLYTLLDDISSKQTQLLEDPLQIPTSAEVIEFVNLYNSYARDASDDLERRALVDGLQTFLQHRKVISALRTMHCPRAPTAPLATVRGPDSVTVVWSRVAYASTEDVNDENLHYQLSWGFQFMGVWRHQMVYSGARVTIGGLDQNQKYAFKVRAKNARGWGKYSEVALISTCKREQPGAENPQENPLEMAETKPRGGLWQRLKQLPALRHAVADGYEQLVRGIIRPPRTRYHIADLGAATFRVGKGVFQRTDFHITSTRGLMLCCSHWEPVDVQRKEINMPVVIHLHGNCGCRVDAIDSLEETLAIGMTVVAIDLSGSGLSEGEYISLGWHEHHEAHTLVQHLKRHRRVSTVHFWGRSMGAVTAIMYAIAHPKAVRAMVLDSPFQDFWVLAMELVSKIEIKIPSVAISMVRMLIRNSTKSRANVDMDKLSPISGIHECATPALFAVGAQDVFVPPHHTKALYEKHGGVKQLAIFPGDHNSMRSKRFIEMAVKFLFTASPQVRSASSDRKASASVNTGTEVAAAVSAATDNPATANPAMANPPTANPPTASKAADSTLLID